jgi:PAS domain S-box-containing protein
MNVRFRGQNGMPANSTIGTREVLKEAILSSLDNQIAVLNKDGVIVDVNEPWRHFARENGAITEIASVGTNYLELLLKLASESPDAKVLLANIRSVTEGTVRRLRYDYRSTWTDEPRWLAVTVTPLQMPGGGVVVCYKDISDVNKAQGEVTLANDRLRLAMECGRSVSWDWDIKRGRGVWFGDLQTILGIASDADAVRVEDFRQHVHPDDQELVWTAVAEAMQHHESCAAEFRIVRPDGSVCWMFASGRFYYAPTGEAERMLGTAVDITRRKQAEQSLKLFRSLADQSHDTIEVVDPETFRFLDINEKACLDLGFTREELLTMRVFDIDPTLKEAERVRIVEGLRKSGFAIKECTHRRKDGSTFPVEVGMKWVQLDRPYIVAAARDISDRKQAENSLRRKEAELAESQRLAQLGSWRWDPKTDTVTWSEELYRIAGRDPASPAVSYKEHSRIYTPESWERLRRAVDNALSSGNSYELDLELIRPDGTTRWVKARGEVLRDAAGNMTGLRGTAQDITASRRMEAALSESEERLRLAVSAGRMYAYEWDAASDIVMRSPEYASILGIANGERLTRRQLLESVHPDDRARFVASVAERTPDDPACQISYRLLRPDGDVIWLEKRARAYFDAHGKMLRVVGMVADITAQKQAEEAVRRSEEKFARIFQASPALMGLTGATDDRFTDVNEAFLRVTGYTRDEVIGHTPAELGICLDASCHRDIIQSLRTEGRLREVESPFGTKTGEKRAGLFSAELIDIGGKRSALTVISDITDRKRAEDELHRREESYRMFVSQSSEGIFCMEMDTPMSLELSEEEQIRHILYDSYLGECNDAIAKMYGLSSAEELRGRRMIEMLDAKDPHNIELTRQYVRSRFKVLERESHERDIHGAPKVFLNSMIGIIEDGMLVRSWGIQRDVTERKRAEEALRKSEEKFSRAFRESPMVVTLTSLKDQRYIDVNETFEHLTGYSRDESVGRTLLEVGNWADPAVGKNLEQQLITDGNVRNAEVRFRRKDGTIRTGLVSMERIEIDGEQCVLAVTADITELKEAQDALLREKIFTDAVLGSVPGLLALFDERGNAVRWNRRAVEISGYTAEEIGRHDIFDFYAEDQRKIVKRARNRMLSEGHAEFEADLRTKSGARIPFYFTSVPLNIDHKTYFVGVGIDMTDRKRVEKERLDLSARLITAQEEERSRIARELHDSVSQRLALLAIKLHELSQKPPASKSKTTASLRALWEQTGEIATDIHHLSSRLHPSILTRIGLVAAVRSLCAELKQHGIDATLSYRNVPSFIPDDISLCLFRVAQEALSNVVQHSGAKQVWVEISGELGQLEMRIADSGHGFDPSNDDHAGLGLLSMKERVRLVSGQFSIQHGSTQGVKIEVRVPHLTQRPDLANAG